MGIDWSPSAATLWVPANRTVSKVMLSRMLTIMHIPMTMNRIPYAGTLSD